MSEIAVVTFNAIPRINHSFKYDRLGQMALVNRRRYCTQHGYRLIEEVSVASDRPACWSKIPALLDALQRHEWVLWADSDALIVDFSVKLEEFCDPAFDLIVQSQDHFFARLGIAASIASKRMPINTGVFIMKASSWSIQFLLQAYEQTQFITRGDVWDGIGEQEAMTWLLNQNPQHFSKIKHVMHLQNHPKLYSSGDMFVHFYGNHGRYLIPRVECEDLLSQWETFVEGGSTFPSGLPRFHWSCIQVKTSGTPLPVKELEHFLYRPSDISV